jgi:hypothetical protein
MNVLGTLNGAGRSRLVILNGVLAVSMLAGALVLAAVTYGLHRLAAGLGTRRPLIAALLLAVLIVLEFTDRTRWLAGNRRVPASWVADEGWRAGLIWGAALGSGLITEAPFGVLHAALILAVLSPASWPAIAVPLLFGVFRLLISVTPAVRVRIIDLADRFVTIAGRSVSVGFLVARLCSRVVLLLVAALALAGVLGG